MGHHLSDGPRDLVTIAFAFGDHGAYRDVAVHALTVYKFGRYDAFPLSVISRLVTFRPLNRFTGYLCDGLPSCQFWASYAFPFSN